MSDLSDQGGAAGAGVADGISEAHENAASRSNWEERVAAARAEREKVLKSKGKPVSKPAVMPPPFVGEDPAAAWDGWDIARVKTAKTTKSQFPPHPGVQQSAISESSSESDPPQNVAPAIASVAIPRTISVNGVVAIAFACFAGLGFGMVLSFGAVVAMGWISIKDFSPSVAANSQVSPQIAPRVQTNPVALPPAPRSDPAIALGYASVVPIIAGKRTAPALSTTARRDLALAEVQSPAPQVATRGVMSEPLSQLDFKPAEISVTFANPAPLATMAVLSTTDDRLGDTPLVVPQKSGIEFLKALPKLHPPIVEKAGGSVRAPEDALTLHTSTPVLSASDRGALPKVIAHRPDKLPVFANAIPNMQTTTSAGSQLLMAVVSDDVPPPRAPIVRVPVLEPVALQMPAIGKPVERSRSLASRLGLSGETVRRINLVTFAPTSVSPLVLARHAEFLDTTGLSVAAANRVNFTVSHDHVRFYSREDELVARALAAGIGGPARDFTTMKNAPPAGRVEIWLEGTRGTAPVTESVSRSADVSDRGTAARAQLEQRLINSLRRGDQFKRNLP